MPYLKVSIEGLKEFKDLLRKNPSLEKTIPDMTLGILQINNVIEKRQKELYNAPGSVSSVFLGKSVKPASLGKTFLTYGLQYKDVPILLSQYPKNALELGTVVESKAPLRKGGELGWVKWTKDRWPYGRELRLKLRKDKPAKFVRRSKRSKFKGFLQHGKVYARTTDKTWKQYPSKGKKGIRNPIVQVYGPSLATIALALSRDDKVVKNAIENILPDILIESLKKQI